MSNKLSSEIIFISDIHIGGHNSIRGRHANDEIETVLQQITQKHGGTNTLFVDCGDTFDNPNPSNYCKFMYRKIFHESASTVLSLGGNHDTPADGSLHPLILSSVMPASNFIYPIVSDLQAHGPLSNDVWIITVPSRALLNPDYTQEVISAIKSQPGLRIILVMHGLVEGISISETYRAKKYDISLADLRKLANEVELVMLGDYHKPCALETELQTSGVSNVYSVGSLLAERFSEASTEHGYWTVSINDKKPLKPVFVQVRDPRSIRVFSVVNQQDADDMANLDIRSPSSIRVIVANKNINIKAPKGTDILKIQYQLPDRSNSIRQEAYAGIKQRMSLDEKLLQWLYSVKGMKQEDINIALQIRKDVLHLRDNIESSPIPLDLCPILTQAGEFEI